MKRILNTKLTIIAIIFLLIILSVNSFGKAGLFSSSDSLKAENKSTVDSSELIIPKKALLISAIFPGLGQLYVHKPLKAVIFSSAEIYHFYQAYRYNGIYEHVKNTKESVDIETWESMTQVEKKEMIVEETGYDLGKMGTWKPRERRNKYSWWCLGIYILGMLDAYVDAHLMYFPEKNVELMSFVDKESFGINLSFRIF